ncbi:MAG TPA: branched-chain amino acid ABC transporter permease [Anaerolineaceae bacterium]|nr:branched-chain amino acid ABC transporter permease [Anaerolineaceae bacterium]
MNLKTMWLENKTWVVLGVLLVLFFVLGLGGMGQENFVRTTLSGLTLGALFFMVASGLTLIFGLMDVLNFAHGTMFMIGAYMGWQFYVNPTFIFGLLPLILALLAGLMLAEPLRPWTMRLKVPESGQRSLRTGLYLGGALLLFIALSGVDFIGMAETAMVSTMVAANPLAEATAQEPLISFWLRPVLLFLAGGLIALAITRPGDQTQVAQAGDSRRGWIMMGVLLLLTAVFTLARENLPITVLQMDANPRFFLALLVGLASGAGLGAVVEITLIRPLYARPIFQVIVTLGMSYVFLELVQLLWSPLAYKMDRPPLFDAPGVAPDIFAWFSGNNRLLDVFGVNFSTYRLFIIFLGLMMFVALMLIMKYTRLGIIIRAGVQDRQMVEALGINVRSVFTTVFLLGVSLAALGGIGAAPFIQIYPNMGNAFQLTAFITVVLGGMGSIPGAAIGALLLGLARAFGDYLALSLDLSPAIAEASTVFIMAVVLLTSPSGLVGKKE